MAVIAPESGELFEVMKFSLGFTLDQLFLPFRGGGGTGAGKRGCRAKARLGLPAALPSYRRGAVHRVAFADCPFHSCPAPPLQDGLTPPTAYLHPTGAPLLTPRGSGSPSPRSGSGQYRAEFTEDFLESGFWRAGGEVGAAGAPVEAGGLVGEDDPGDARACGKCDLEGVTQGLVDDGAGDEVAGRLVIGCG